VYVASLVAGWFLDWEKYRQWQWLVGRALFSGLTVARHLSICSKNILGWIDGKLIVHHKVSVTLIHLGGQALAPFLDRCGTPHLLTGLLAYNDLQVTHTGVRGYIAVSLTMTHGRVETLLDDLKLRSIGY
jgi:hypothetical protein